MLIFGVDLLPSVGLSIFRTISTLDDIPVYLVMHQLLKCKRILSLSKFQVNISMHIWHYLSQLCKIYVFLLIKDCIWKLCKKTHIIIFMSSLCGIGVRIGVKSRNQGQYSRTRIKIRGLDKIVPISQLIKDHLAWWMDPQNVVKGSNLHQ